MRCQPFGFTIRIMRWTHMLSVLGIVGTLLLAGCDGGSGAGEATHSDEITIYTSIDQPFAEAVIEQFRTETGIRVRLITDTEASKSVGLAERAIAEKSAPKADVWWGNEVFYTLRLVDEDVLAPYESPSASDIPARYRDPQHRWTGQGLRARVLAFSTSTDVQFPSNAESIHVLADPKLKGKVLIARPTAGTTGGHVAALYVLLGDEQADAYFRSLRENEVAVVGGNAIVAQQVGFGQFLVGLTDNDDVDAVFGTGGRLKLVLPDQRPNQIGTLTIPTTVGLIKNGPGNPENAKRLIDYLLSARIEQMLIERRFARYSVRPGSSAETVKAMEVDYNEVARKMPEAIRRVTAILEGR